MKARIVDTEQCLIFLETHGCKCKSLKKRPVKVSILFSLFYQNDFSIAKDLLKFDGTNKALGGYKVCVSS